MTMISNEPKRNNIPLTPFPNKDKKKKEHCPSSLMMAINDSPIKSQSTNAS